MMQLVRMISRQADELDARVIEVDHHKQLSFESLGVTPEMIQVLKEKGIEAAFPIQSATYSHAFNGMDIIARERTGSGKTIAYALPLIERLRKEHNLGKKSATAAKVLVLVPTRELCVQVSREIESLQLYAGEVRVVSLFGGSDIGQQIYALKRGVDVIVATPGRLSDHLERGTVDPSGISKVVLDETDEMLNIGFKDKITEIIAAVKRASDSGSLQFLLFSATVPQWVKKTAREFMSDDIYFIDMVKDSEHKTATGVQHLRMPMTEQSQLPAAISYLIDTYAGDQGRTIVFTNTKVEANKIAHEGKVNTSVAVLHGDIPQDRRQKTFDDFKVGITKCLIATNVAARGLDFPKVDLVVQVSPPADVDSYIHRSGRTGRAGHTGVCITLFNQRDTPILREIERVAKIKFDDVAPMNINKILSNKGDKLVETLEDVKREAADVFLSIAEEMIQKYGAQEALARTIAIYLDYTKPVTVYSSHKRRPSMTTIKIDASSEVEGLLSEELALLLHDKYFTNSNRSLICNVNNQDLDVVQTAISEVEDFRVSYPTQSDQAPEREGYSRQSSTGRRDGFSRQGSTGRRDGYDRPDRERDSVWGPNRGGHSQMTGSSNNLINTIFFLGAPEGAEENQITEALEQAGVSVRSVRIFKDRETGVSKGTGIITPSTSDDFDKMLDMATIRVEGKSVKLKKNQPIGRP